MDPPGGNSFRAGKGSRKNSLPATDAVSYFREAIKRMIRIDFCDFWRYLNKNNNFFSNLLRERFDIKICDRPDFLIYSNNGHVHRIFNGVKIYYTHEPIQPDFNECDFAFSSFYLDDPRHMRLPWYAVLYDSPTALIQGPDFPSAQKILGEKTKFCSYMVSNHSQRRNRNRLEIFEKLSKYKRVESGGRFMNNVGGPILGGFQGKIDFMRPCKFHIAFENASLPGYTTEKLPQAMMARTLPIYWGDPQVARDFNPESFIDASKFPNLDALVEHIIKLDQDDALYAKVMSQPYFYGNKPTEWFDRQRLLDRFEQIFNSPVPTKAAPGKRKTFSFGRWMLVKRHDFDD
jgi:alpha(1,3/1,4) fucosyltransferase